MHYFILVRNVIAIILLSSFGDSCAFALESATATVKYVQGTENRIYTRSVGHASSVLIALSGGPGASSEYMEDLDPLAKLGFRVITFDARGTGRSTLNKNKNYAPEAYVEDIEAIRMSVDAEKIVLFGHSFGGLTSMQYAIAHPERVQSIILYGSASPDKKSLDEAGSNLAKHIEFLQRLKQIPQILPEMTDLPAFMNAIEPAYFSDFAFKPRGNFNSTHYSFEAYSETLKALGDFDLRSKLQKLHIPVLIASGADDPFGPAMGHSVAVAFNKDFATERVIDHCGHFCIECEDKFIKTVTEYLKLHPVHCETESVEVLKRVIQ